MYVGTTCTVRFHINAAAGVRTEPKRVSSYPYGLIVRLTRREVSAACLHSTSNLTSCMVDLANFPRTSQSRRTGLRLRPVARRRIPSVSARLRGKFTQHSDPLSTDDPGIMLPPQFMECLPFKATSCSRSANSSSVALLHSCALSRISRSP